VWRPWVEVPPGHPTDPTDPTDQTDNASYKHHRLN